LTQIKRRFAAALADQHRHFGCRLPFRRLLFGLGHESGRRKHKYFQWLTTNVGFPKLRDHIGSVVTIMKLSNDWHDFRAKLDRLHPAYGKPTQLALDFAEDEPDTGKGL
jgi:hypothetical protein